MSDLSTPGTLPAPPTKHQLALMIWLAVFPTLTLINVVFENCLTNLHPVLRTFVLATVTVPIVTYGILPYLHRLRYRLLGRSAGSLPAEGRRGT